MQYWLITDFPDDEVVCVGRGYPGAVDSFEYYDPEADTWVSSFDLWAEVQTEPGYDRADRATALTAVSRLRNDYLHSIREPA